MRVQSPQKMMNEPVWKILIIEIVEETFLIVRNMLNEARGRTFEVHWASTYAAGREELTHHDYHAVLVDYDLGSHTGIELIREVNERGTVSPLVLFSGRGNYEVDVDAMQAGAAMYLTRDEVNPSLLERVIRYAVERKQAEKIIVMANTEREQAEAALRANAEVLRESNEKYRIFFENLRESVVLFEAVRDDQGNLIDLIAREANPPALAATGLDKEGMLGRRASELFPSEALERAIIHLPRMFETGKPWTDEQVVDGRNYRYTVFRMNKNLIAVSSEDITERKQAEAALLESEERERHRAQELSAILDAVPAYIFITHDPDSRTITGNRAANEVLRGWRAANMSKKAPGSGFPRQFRAMRDGKEIPNEELPLQFAAAKCTFVQDSEFDIVFDDGSSKRLIGNAAPLCDAHGKPAGAVGAFIDITELRRIEHETQERIGLMEAQRRLLEHREMERSQLARDLHDGPIQSLGALTFSLQMLQSTIENGQVGHAQQASDAQEAQKMIEQVKQDVRDLAGELRGVCNELRPPLLERFGFRKAIEAHAEGFQEKHPELKMVLDMTKKTVKLPENVATALFRIYQEALNNVVRHSEATEMTIRVAFDPQQFLLEVQDNGKGLPKKPDWMELVHQGHFGLVGMKERTEAIGGEFEVISAPGKGTTIRVTAPFSMKNR